ncbi:hypothetical protein [Curtobacterium citreum]|uniref:Uncharacterized protein n=1 Tax=Curtobacterium citreum TaxID=2036 RepID=A0ABU8YEA9_9MICO
MASPWTGIIEDARHYPSPHNSQPIVVRVEDDRTATVFYDLRRGLPAESFGIPFGHVCAGVFLAGLEVVARAHGFAVQERLDHAEMDFGRLDAGDSGAADDHLHRLGTVRLRPRAVTADDREALAVFLARRTSRRPYDATLVDDAAVDAASAIASAAGQRFRTTSDRATVDEIVRVNQETLFDDLQHDAVHDEILHWLRFSKRQAVTTGDGLSAETMLMPGPVLRFAMEHRGLWEAPGVGAVFKRVYLSTMRGVRQLGWLEGPFRTPADYVEAGRVFMRIWLEFSARGIALHPFGTVITNPRSHAAFVERAGVDESDGRMAWMLFRFGHSDPPPLAHRRPAAAMTLGGAR